MACASQQPLDSPVVTPASIRKAVTRVTEIARIRDEIERLRGQAFGPPGALAV